MQQEKIYEDENGGVNFCTRFHGIIFPFLIFQNDYIDTQKGDGQNNEERNGTEFNESASHRLKVIEKTEVAQEI